MSTLDERCRAYCGCGKCSAYPDRQRACNWTLPQLNECRFEQFKEVIASEVGLLIDCDRCLKPLKVQGGLLFGPPGESGCPVKLHVCFDCWGNVLASVDPEERT